MKQQEQYLLARYIRALIESDYKYRLYSDYMDIDDMCTNFVKKVDEFLS